MKYFISKLIILSAALFTCGPVVPGTKLTNSKSSKSKLSNPKPRLIVDTKWNFLVGAFASGKWVKTPQAQRWAGGGESYTVFQGPRLLGSFRGSKAVSPGSPCEDAYHVKLQLPPYKPKGLLARRLGPPGYVAVSGASAKQLMPRIVQPVSPAAYNEVVKLWLRGRGLQNPQPGLVKVWRVDLDGDGRPEVLINAVRHGAQNGLPNIMSPNSRAGDHALLLVRRATGGQVKTIAVFSQIHTQNANLNVPSFLELAGVLDVNGDGQMEIIARGRYYQGNWSSVYEWRGGYPQAILSSGCGV
jgi:hypothetical protein